MKRLVVACAVTALISSLAVPVQADEEVAIRVVREIVTKAIVYQTMGKGFDSSNPRMSKFPARLDELIVQGLSNVGDDGLSAIAADYRFTYVPSGDLLTFVVRAEPLQPSEIKRVVVGTQEGVFVNGIDVTGKVEPETIAYLDNAIKQIAAQASYERLVGTTKRGTLVRFSVGQAGQLQDARVIMSAGDSELDQIAIRAIHDASPFEPFPTSITEETLHFIVSLPEK